jgi:ferredoxin
MIISMRDLTYEELKKKLTPEDKIVLYSCNACIVACGVGGNPMMDKLEEALISDGFNVIGKDLISIGCAMNLVKKRRTQSVKKRLYDEATVVIPLICEDGYEALHEVFDDKRIIRTTKTIGVGNFTPDRGVILTTPFESTGLEKNVDGYTLDQVAEKIKLHTGAFGDDKDAQKEKVSLLIDDQEITAVKGQNLLEVCAENGIDIPHFCHHDDLSSYGACRLCVVKIKGARDLAASCCVKVEDGMNITTSDVEIEGYRKMILELIMASGDHNCLTCTKGVSTPFATCELQKMVRAYDIKESRFETLYEERAEDNSSQLIYYDANKCILCGRCVRACEEIAGLSNLGFINRGEKTVVKAGLNVEMNQSECVTCMACANVCPTGALIEKVVYFNGEDWKSTRKLG